MKPKLALLLLISALFGSPKAQTIVYHNVVTDTGGNLISWYSPDHGASYDHCLDLVWNFWKNIPTCCGGHKFYMIDHSYSNPVGGNKLGGDQFAMALSSWALYYAYTGDTALIADMKYIADTYLANSLTPFFAVWKDLPYSCNYTNTFSAVYDGDFILGAGFVQPDKAGSFGAELLTLYKITGDSAYLNAAIKIANTLSAKVQPGSATVSPFPFKVNAETGALPGLPAAWHYTANVIPTMRLFEGLKELNHGNISQYDSAYTTLKNWVKQYPLQTDEWGSFFEDIPVPSNTEINAVTAAYYILEKGNAWSNTWQQDARHILDWVLTDLGSHAYDTLGVTAIYEQSVDLKEGGSHTSRFASAELLYAEKTGDTSRVEQAIRQLDWATYLVDFDGQCRFSPRSGSVWYTDGYGDYVRHFVRSMGTYPAISYGFANHLLRSASVVTSINYQPLKIDYYTYNNTSSEVLRLVSKPALVKGDGVVLSETTNPTANGWTWEPMGQGGVLRVYHNQSRHIEIEGLVAGINSILPLTNINVYPNPATESVNAQLTAQPGETLTVQVVNINGEVIATQQLTATNANVNIKVNTAAYTAGAYTLQATGKTTHAHGRFVVSR